MRDRKPPVNVRLKPGISTSDSQNSPSLPSEVLTNVVQHAARKDLFRLQTLTKQFFILATTEIYSTLEFRFTNSDARDYDTPVTRFSDALQTIVTSDYDYAQHIKNFSTAISPESPMNALMMARFLWGSDQEPSKALNATLLLVLRKAKAMETFQWGVPVELSGLVYQALQRIPTLRNLAIYLGGSSMTLSILQTYAGHPPPPGAIGGANPTQPTANTILSATPSSSNPWGSGSSWSKRAAPKNNDRYDFWRGRRSLSKFNGLKTLILNDISDLECLDEIAGCLRASSSSLKSLTLSLSLELALKARKPDTTAPGVAGDDSDPDLTESEDEAGNPPVVTQAAQATNAAEVQKDRLAQDAILAKIFSLQDVANEGKKLEKHFVLPREKSAALKSTVALVRMRLREIKATMTGTNINDPEAKRLILNLEKTLAEANSNYSGSNLAGWGLSGSSASSGNSSVQALSSSAAPTNTPTASATIAGLSQDQAAQIQNLLDLPIPSALADSLDIENWPLWSDSLKQALSYGVNTTLNSTSTGPSLQSQAALPTPFPAANNISTAPVGLLSLPDPEPQPDYAAEDLMDVDMEHPDESVLDIGANEEMGDIEAEGQMGNDDDEPKVTTSSSPRKRARFGNMSSDLISVGESDHASLAAPSIKGKGKEPETTAVVNAAESLSIRKTKDDSIKDYVRATHGLQLEAITLYLIPLKASIVARALDLRVLKRITLLDVGTQAPFWNLLHRLSSSSPEIGFESIHTDDVSHSLLRFLAASSHGVKELYLQKRKARDPELESSAGPVNVGAIFKVGLRKHFKTLTHLMLKNDNDDSWDVDDRAVRFLGLKGWVLVELAISMRIKTMHTLIQHISKLTSLRVLYFLNLRTSGATSPGPSILEIETASLLSDAMTYHDNRNLRYLAIGERYAKIESPAEVRKRCRPLWKEAKKTEKLKQNLGESKASRGSGGEAAMDYHLGDEDDSWDENGLDYIEIKAKEVQLRWSGRFWEIKNVRIFERVKRTGKLH